MDTANYVMTYASKSPHRDSGGPVKIFNLQVIQHKYNIEKLIVIAHVADKLM